MGPITGVAKGGYASNGTLRTQKPAEGVVDMGQLTVAL